MFSMIFKSVEPMPFVMYLPWKMVIMFFGVRTETSKQQLGQKNDSKGLPESDQL